MGASSAAWPDMRGVGASAVDRDLGMAALDPEPAPIAGLEAHLGEMERWVRQRYQGHPWLDDLVAEARLGAYRGLIKCQGRRMDMAGVARRAGLWAAADWLRGAGNEERRQTRCGCSRPQRVWPAAGDDIEEGLHGAAAATEFEEAVVARLDSARLLARAVAAGWISALEAEIVQRVTMAGEASRSVGVSLGLTRRRCGLLKRRALAELRAHWEREAGK